MSWSFQASGAPAEVLAAAKRQIEFQKCVEPEESIKLAALDAIDKALSAMDEGDFITVEAYGSQVARGGDKEGKFRNNLFVRISPV